MKFYSTCIRRWLHEQDLIVKYLQLVNEGEKQRIHKIITSNLIVHLPEQMKPFAQLQRKVFNQNITIDMPIKEKVNVPRHAR